MGDAAIKPREINLQRHQAFWSREPTDRPLFGCNIGKFLNERFPKIAETLPEGIVRPEDVLVEPFLEDCERLFEMQSELHDDYSFVACALRYIPWMEAIMGCPIVASPTTLWAEPFVNDWDEWRYPPFALDNPWMQKLLELLQAVAEQGKGRYSIGTTLMRGPADILAAMRGPVQFATDVIDYPDVIFEAAALCAETWVSVAKVQLDLIPDALDGYMDAEGGCKLWSPQKHIWYQEDAMALLSPRIYRELFLPVDRFLASEFPSAAIHLHGVAEWGVTDLISVPELGVIEIDFDDARTIELEERIYQACETIQASKRLIVFRNFDEGFWRWLDQFLTRIPCQAVAIQTSVQHLEEGKMVADKFYRRFQ